MNRHDDATLRGRVDALDELVVVGADRFDVATRDRITRATTAVRERLALGVDHTVVALAGGTGSGKSSTFNALTGLNFADVGIKRPTTFRLASCCWSDDADALLDWVGVSPDRRINQTGDLAPQTDHPGLVLLDLPDHDSVEQTHREMVDRVLPLVDVLIWVVDPQKYADHALHSGYLRQGLVGDGDGESRTDGGGGARGGAGNTATAGSMIVLLNQVDKVPPARRDELLADLKRLLAADGLADVETFAVSAATGEGIDTVHQRLAVACRGRSITAGRAAAELDAVAADVLSRTPPAPPWDADGAIDRELPAFVDATGLDAVAGQVYVTIRHGYGVPEVPRPDASAIAVARSAWLTHCGATLPPRWLTSLGQQVESANDLRKQTIAALHGLELDVSAPRGVRALRRIAGVCAGLAALLAVVGLLDVFGAVDLGQMVALPCPYAPWPGVVLLVLAAGACWLWATLARRRLGVKRADQVAATGRDALRKVIADGLAAPTGRLLADYGRVRNLAQAARDNTV
ncbi:MAG: 50S ribosome-binding GTPase [Cellulomonadaceae bacterium]|nr:50S ribosome-binding GTPase [Cellulomonadaceae bacterium]